MFQRQNNRKLAPLIQFTLNFYGTAHLIHQSLCYRHAKTRSLIIRSGTILLLGKWFKNVFQIIPAHTNPRIGYLKAESRDTVLFRNLMAPEANASLRLIVFHRIAGYIDENLFDVQGTSLIICMGQLIQL